MPAGQLDLFAPAPALPPGFRHWDEAVPREEERALLEAFAALDFAAFAFHGHVGRRRVVSFGRAYDFEREALRDAPPIPPFLLALRGRVAPLAGLAPRALVHALVTEYPPGAGIGWHRDKAAFGDVLGVSLGAPCLFRLRRRAGASWRRASSSSASRRRRRRGRPRRSTAGRTGAARTGRCNRSPCRRPAT